MIKMKVLKKRMVGGPDTDSQIGELVALEKSLAKLPPMSDLQKAKMEHSMAIDHLYYSSKIEGTHLTKKRIDKAIYGQEVPEA